MGNKWNILVLEVDKPSEEVGDMLELLYPGTVRRAKVEFVCKSSKQMLKSDIRSAVKIASNGLDGPVLTAFGSGKYHHYDYGLCTEIADRIAKKRNGEYAYILFDCHDDAVDAHSYWFDEEYGRDRLDCASFVFSTARDSDIRSERNVIGVGGASMGEIFGGMTENDIRDWRQEYGLKATIENLLARIKVDDVYVSIDLDVMSSAEVRTDFDQGNLYLEELLDLVRAIQDEKNIISASVLGYSATKDAKSLITYAAAADVITESNRLDIREWACLHGYAKRGIIGYDDVLSMAESGLILE